MTSFTDNSFPYVLICSTFGTIVSLASVWLATAQSFSSRAWRLDSLVELTTLRSIDPRRLAMPALTC